jgi:hypothetical protein
MAGQSALESSLAVIFGQAVTRAVLLREGELCSTFTLRIPGELSYNLAAVGKEIENSFGKEVYPSRVVVCGPSSDLERLSDLGSTVITEEKAVGAAEKYLTGKLGGPTAVLDVGPSAYLDHFPADKVSRWLPFIVNLTDIENHLANKRDYPRVIPVLEHDYEIDLAVVRQAIVKIGERQGKDYLEVADAMNLVVTGGLLSGISRAADLLAVLMDSFVFRSGARIYLDELGELSAFGALISDLESTDYDYTKHLLLVGSGIHLNGEKADIMFGVHDKQRLTVGPGDIVNLPIGEEQPIQIKASYQKGSVKFELNGGGAGIYLDNRPRPLDLVSGSRDSMSRVIQWRKLFETSKLFEEENDTSS